MSMTEGTPYDWLKQGFLAHVNKQQEPAQTHALTETAHCCYPVVVKVIWSFLILIAKTLQVYVELT